MALSCAGSSIRIPPVRPGRVPLSPCMGFTADVSPDGSRIVYSSCEFTIEERPSRYIVYWSDYPFVDTGYEIGVIDVDGTGQVRLTKNGDFDSLPVWSPDGTEIAFVGHSSMFFTAHDSELYTMYADGSRVQRVFCQGRVLTVYDSVTANCSVKMSFMKGLTLNQKEQNRLQVMNRLLEGVLDVGEASELLGVSQRQVRRLRAAYREEGACALAHGNRGRAPIHKVSQEVRAQVVELGSGRYAGFNHTHLTEELGRHEGIALSRSTVRRILSSAGMRSPRKRRGPKHRVRRERYAQEGMLLQVDGSRHDWLEGRGPYLTLIGAVDDATGTIPYALFREQEDAHGYFLLTERVIRDKGIPLALYSDRHGIFQRSPFGGRESGGAVGRGAQPHPVRQGNEGVGH